MVKSLVLGVAENKRLVYKCNKCGKEYPCYYISVVYEDSDATVNLYNTIIDSISCHRKTSKFELDHIEDEP